MPETVKIINKLEVPSAEPDRVGKFTAVITYRTSSGQVYIARMPDEEASDTAKLKKAIEKDIAGRKKIIGQEIELP